MLLESVYLKDLSYEAPNVPGALAAPGGEPKAVLDMKIGVRRVSEERYEVVLHLQVHAQSEGRTVFLVELDQGGLFSLPGAEEEELQRLLQFDCVNALYPYAREAIGSVVARGGFAPLLLRPLDFAAMAEKSAVQSSTQAENHDKNG